MKHRSLLSFQVKVFSSKFWAPPPRGGGGLLLRILGGAVPLGSPNHDPILTAYIMGASRNLSYILQIPPCSASLERVWCFAVSLLKLPCFAILSTFRCISKLPQLSRSLPISLPWCGKRYAVRINYHFRPKKMLCSAPVFRLEIVTKRKINCLHKTEIMSSLLRLKPQQKYFFKSVSYWHITVSFLFIWNWNDEHNDTQP